MIIERREAQQLKKIDSWILVYGRRKTGKTFLLRRYVNWNLYITVTRSFSAITEERNGDIRFSNIKDALLNVTRYIESGGIVVIDEFQRVPYEFWDLIAVTKHRGGGKVILCGSSFSITRDVFDKRSPLLGLFAPIEIGLVHPADAIYSFQKIFSVKDAFLWGLIARDPWILGLVKPKNDVTTTIIENYKPLVSSVSGLIGEVFEEEDRKLTRLYDAVLRLLSLNYWSSADIAQKLYESRLIEKPEMGIVTGILNQLYNMGFVDKVKLVYTRGGRTYYRHKSSLISLLLYIDEKYGDRDVKPNLDDIASKIGFELQFFLGEILAEYKKLDRGYLIMPRGEGDIDIVLLSRGRPVIAYEVKIGPITVNEARKAVKNMERYDFLKTGLISLSEEPPQLADEVLGPEKLVNIVRGLRGGLG